jgi:isocitrate/isopropylmalate dehydrogenase
MATYCIAVIPGDGIGKEVVPEGLRVLEAVGRRFDISFKCDEWSASMMLEHLGHGDGAEAIIRAIETVLAEGPRTQDIGGNASTSELGKAIADAI